MKGLILAGGSGSRLHPITIAFSKQLMPVYDKPMIYYPLSVLLLADIKEIMIICTQEDIHLFKKLLGDGTQWGISIQYTIQKKPNGIAEAFILTQDFIQDSKVALILGDNIFYGRDLPSLLKTKKDINGACVFAYPVSTPNRYGVVSFDKNNKVISIEEKPEYPKSNYSVPGLYFYDQTVVSKAKKLKPSARGELEITDLNNLYLKEGKLEVGILSRGTAWLDTGTFEDLQNASEFIRIIEQRQGFKISCIEEIVFRKKWISKEQLLTLAAAYKNSPYGEYLKTIASQPSID